MHQTHLARTMRAALVIVAASIATLVVSGRPCAQVTPAPPLTAEQEALVDDLTHSLVAPCCWTASVAEHGSGQAPVLEAQIRRMVHDGMTREAIIDHYLAEYGERILVEPRRRGFNVLAYWMPWIAGLCGALGIVYFVKRRRPAETHAAPSVPATESDPYRRRVREELLRLDD